MFLKKGVIDAFIHICAIVLDSFHCPFQVTFILKEPVVIGDRFWQVIHLTITVFIFWVLFYKFK